MKEYIYTKESGRKIKYLVDQIGSTEPVTIYQINEEWNGVETLGIKADLIAQGWLSGVVNTTATILKAQAVTQNATLRIIESDAKTLPTATSTLSAMAWTTTAPDAVTSDTAYSFQFEVENATLPVTFTTDDAEDLPSGLILSEDGVISGLPQDAAGTFSATIYATDVEGVEVSEDFDFELAASAKTDFLTFSLEDQTAAATINKTAHTIAITVANGTTVTALAATFTLDYGATAKVGATAQVSGTTTNNFTNPVVYAVTAQDTTTAQNWTITVTVAEE